MALKEAFNALMRERSKVIGIDGVRGRSGFYGCISYLPVAVFHFMQCHYFILNCFSGKTCQPAGNYIGTYQIMLILRPPRLNYIWISFLFSGHFQINSMLSFLRALIPIPSIFVYKSVRCFLG